MVSTSSLLQKFGMLSANQMNVQLKLVEVWKAMNVQDYPLKITLQTIPETGTTTRASLKGRPIEMGRTNLLKSMSTSDAIRIWNLAPASINESASIDQVKNAIKSYVRTLPI